jgi:hypothetical protein
MIRFDEILALLDKAMKLNAINASLFRIAVIIQDIDFDVSGKGEKVKQLNFWETISYLILF